LTLSNPQTDVQSDKETKEYTESLRNQQLGLYIDIMFFINTDTAMVTGDHKQ